MSVGVAFARRCLSATWQEAWHAGPTVLGGPVVPGGPTVEPGQGRLGPALWSLPLGKADPYLPLEAMSTFHGLSAGSRLGLLGPFPRGRCARPPSFSPGAPGSAPGFEGRRLAPLWGHISTKQDSCIEQSPQIPNPQASLPPPPCSSSTGVLYDPRWPQLLALSHGGSAPNLGLA